MVLRSGLALTRRVCDAALQLPGGRGWCALLDAVDIGNRAQHFAAIAEDDAKLFQVLIGQFAKDREINAVFSKTLGVLGHAELFEPVGNLLHRGPRPLTCSLASRLPVYPFELCIVTSVK